MKAFSLIFLSCVAVSAFGQTTPFLNFSIPAHGALNWDTNVNGNFSSLDNLLSGHSTLPGLKVTTLQIAGSSGGVTTFAVPASLSQTLTFPSGTGTICTTTTCSGSLSGLTFSGDIVATGTTTATSSNRVCEVTIQSGADFCAKVNACYTAASTNTNRAGIIDARGFGIGNATTNFQVCNSDPFAGANKSGILYLPCTDIYISAHWNTPQKKFRVVGCGQSSPLGTGNLMSEEGTILRPCTGVNTPVTGCAGSIAVSNNQLFIDPVYNITTCTEIGTTATCTTSTQHNYTFTSGSQTSHVVVTGNSVGGYNSGGSNPAYFQLTAVPSATQISFTVAASGLGTGNGGTVTAPIRQHGRYSKSGSGLNNPGNYYTMIAQGGRTSGNGYDGNGTCGTGPVGADWTLSSFGSTFENLAISNDGLAGLIGIYSGSIQERGGFRDVSFNNYGGAAGPQTEENGFMYDRNSWNLNDKCANASGNGGPSHFDISHIFCDASPAAANGALDTSGICGQLAGTHSESDGTDMQDTGVVNGLAQYGINCMGTYRGLNASGTEKSNYGFWIENYDDGTVDNCHFENLLHDPVYMQGVSGHTTQGWLLMRLDFGSSSGTNNAVVHFGTGTNNNRVMMVRGASGANPAGVRDEVFGCSGAFGAAAPCIVNGNTGGNPVIDYAQGGLQLPMTLQLGNTSTPTNLSAGTGAPTGACSNGNVWLRTDNGAGSSMYVCKNSAWAAIN